MRSTVGGERGKNLAFALVAVGGFFFLVEAALWLAGVPTLLEERDPFAGFSASVRVFEEDPASGTLRTPPRAVRHSFNPQAFLAEKPRGGLRVFVLGGSSAYGFPWGARSAFPRFLKDALQASFPDRRVEVVNAAGMSYGSHRLRIVVREVLRYEPDLLILYGGHNEFVERRFYRDAIGRRESLDRAGLFLNRSRLFSVMTRGYEGFRGGDRHAAPEGAEAADLLGLDVSREHSADVTPAERDEAHRRFEENVRDVLRQASASGVPVLVCTVPSNLRGWKPNQSAFPPDATAATRRAASDALARGTAALGEGRLAEGLESLRRARSLAPGHAEIEYRYAQALETSGDPDEARAAYARARDLDASPTRADTTLNAILRRLAEEEDATLVDVERRFEELSPGGVVGFEWIQDYVHPNPRAHRRIAFEIWQTLRERGIAMERGPAPEEVFWAAVGGKDGRDEVEAEANAPALVYNLAVVLENQGLLGPAMEKYRESRDMGPTHFVEASASLGRLLLQQDRPAEAAEEFLAAVQRDPGHVKSLVGLAESLRRLGRAQGAETYLDRATRVDPGYAYAWNRLGVVLAEGGRLDEAERAFARAVQLEPGDAGFAADRGFALLAARRLDEAEAAFRRSVEILPGPRRAWNGLAAVRAERGDLEGAASILRESLRLDPSDRGAAAGLQVVEKARTGGR